LNHTKTSVRDKMIELLPEIWFTVQNEKAGKGAGPTMELCRTVTSIEDD
jgi:hypothetical protein